MSGDHARWLENEIALVLTYDLTWPLPPEPVTPVPETPEEG